MTKKNGLKILRWDGKFLVSYQVFEYTKHKVWGYKNLYNEHYLENNLFKRTYANKTKKMIIEPQVIVETNLFSKILDGIKIITAITTSIQTDITLAIPLGSSFQPNDLIKGLFQKFIN